MDNDRKHVADESNANAQLAGAPKRYPTEQECEILQYRITHGEEGEPYEKEIVFGMTGAASVFMLSLLSWAIFKQVWFGWLGMPGWW